MISPLLLIDIALPATPATASSPAVDRKPGRLIGGAGLPRAAQLSRPLPGTNSSLDITQSMSGDEFVRPDELAISRNTSQLPSRTKTLGGSNRCR